MSVTAQRLDSHLLHNNAETAIHSHRSNTLVPVAICWPAKTNRPFCCATFCPWLLPSCYMTLAAQASSFADSYPPLLLSLRSTSLEGFHPTQLGFEHNWGLFLGADWVGSWESPLLLGRRAGAYSVPAAYVSKTALW